MNTQDYTQSPAARKRMARLMAAQGIYSQIASGSDEWDVEEMLESLTRWRRYAIDDDLEEQHRDDYIETPEKLPKIQPDRTLLKKLLHGVAEDYEQLDELIEPYLTDDWSLDRMHILLVTLLRLATYELQTFSNTAPAVIIKEYVVLAEALLPESEKSFLHAVVDKISKQLRG